MSPLKSPDTNKILVIDDEPDLCTLYELTLLREGYLVDTAATVGEARAQLRDSTYDLVITDMRMPDGTGLDLLRELRVHHRKERCIVITAFGSADNAVESLKAGAFDYLTKPVDLKQFRSAVAAAIRATKITAIDTAAAEPVIARSSISAPDTPHADAFMRMAGDSAGMRSVRERIAKVARSMAPVLIRGESGTGKELVAQALHAHSHRREGPWVAVNCGAIPETLLEAEFFGARKGAYTGATHDRPGFFQAAHGGTLFLDEIGDLPIAMQAKLLRAIQERQIRPLGASLEEPVDVRIVSATHKDLPAEVQAGRFRQDLFYRLNVIEIAIPPLRERLQDLPALCDALLHRIATESGLPMRPLSKSAIAGLRSMPLAGNVRELENILHRAVALSEGPELELQDVAPPTTTASAADGVYAPAHTGGATLQGALPHDLQRHLDDQECAILRHALREANFDHAAAARRLGLSVRQWRYRIARLHIESEPGTRPQTDTGHGEN